VARVGGCWSVSASDAQRGPPESAGATLKPPEPRPPLPGDARVLGVTGRFAVWMGRTDAGFASVRRAVVLDPLNPRSHYVLGRVLYFARRYDEAIAAWSAALSVEPKYKPAHGFRGLTYYALGNLESARSSCEFDPEYWLGQWCLSGN